MRKFGILAAVVAGALIVPAGAGAAANGSDCSYTTTGDPAAGVQAGPGGMTGTATLAVGACVNAPTPVGTLQGGSVEAGVGNGTQAYAVIDGDNQNADPGDGYLGLSNYETGTQDASCADGPDQGQAGTSNSGRCFGADGGPWVDLSAVPAPRPICGNTSGNSWNNTNRDGCSNP